MPTPESKQRHVYHNAHWLEIIDADTIQVALDYGFNTWGHWRCRLAGVDAPEKSTPAGKAVIELVRFMLTASPISKVESLDWDKYANRFNGVIHIGKVNPLCLNQHLLDRKLVKPYAGGKRSWTADELDRIVDKAKAYAADFKIPVTWATNA